MSPAFSRHLRDRPEGHFGRISQPTDERQGLIQDLAIRLIALDASLSRDSDIVARVAQVSESIQADVIWHFEGTGEGSPRPESPRVRPPSLLASWSTDHIESAQLTPKRKYYADQLRAMVPQQQQPVLSHEIREGLRVPDFNLAKTAETMAIKLAYQRPAAANEPLSLLLNQVQIPYRAQIVPIALGLQAYGFMPEEGYNAPPILLFRGTVTSPAHRAAGVTWLADLDPFGVGWAVFQFGHGGIGGWLEKARAQTGKKALVFGHSLGGAHAAYTGVYFPDEVEKVYAFNPPAVSFLAKRQWDWLQQQGREVPEIINICSSRDDICHFGHEEVGTTYFVHVAECTANSLQGPDDLWPGHPHHSQCMLGLPHILVQRPRSLGSLRYLVSVVGTLPALLMYALVIAKRLLVGHQSGSQYANLLGWVSLMFRALATVLLQLAVLTRMGILKLRGRLADA